jgi:hypothetical protein
VGLIYTTHMSDMDVSALSWDSGASLEYNRIVYKTFIDSWKVVDFGERIDCNSNILERYTSLHYRYFITC